MTVFDQRGQTVNYQFNIAGDLNMGDVQSKQEAIDQLKKLQAEMGRAVESKLFDEDVATDAQYEVKKAVIEAQKPHPDKKTIADRLAGAKTLIEGVSAAGGLVNALAKAAEVVQQFY